MSNVTVRGAHGAVMTLSYPSQAVGGLVERQLIAALERLRRPTFAFAQVSFDTTTGELRIVPEGSDAGDRPSTLSGAAQR